MLIIPENLSKKERNKFLTENKAALIAQKKSVLKYTDSVISVPEFSNKNFVLSKMVNSGNGDNGVLRVKVVANTSMWCDSHMDVLGIGCWDKSIKERKGLIPHLHDHIHEIGAKVGEVVDIYSQDLSLSELGIMKSGTAQSLVFETDVMRSYNEKVYNQYRDKKVKQHSIGLMYMKIGLAINDEEDTAHYDLWQKHIDNIINRDYVEEKGFFWYVPEIKLLENSAVLFGSNILTPTLSTDKSAVDDNTDEQPQKSTSADFKTIMQTLKSN